MAGSERIMQKPTSRSGIYRSSEREMYRSGGQLAFPVPPSPTRTSLKVGGVCAAASAMVVE